MFGLILKYIVTTVVPGVIFIVSRKHVGDEAAVAIGGAVAGVGARMLHTTEPPAKK